MKPLLSIAIMAVPERKAWAEELSLKLDAPISWDVDRVIWNTCKGAWKLHNPEAKYHLVVQDDAIVCDDFRNEAERFILETEKREGADITHAFYFYYGNHNGFKTLKEEQDAIQNGYLLKTHGMNGVAICMPTSLVAGLIQFGDSYGPWQDDEKISQFLKLTNAKVWVPFPTLVDHRRKAENPSIIAGHRTSLDRYSPWFKGNKQPEMLIEQAIPRLIHQVWIGNQQQRPTRFIEGWTLPGWQHKLWTEPEIDAFFLEFPDNADAYRWYYEQKLWHGAVDVLRYELLKQFGGWYIDADERRIAEPKEFDALFVDTDFFAVEENQEGLIANGILAAIPHHPIFEDWSRRISQLPRTNQSLVPAWKNIGCVLLVDIYKDYQAKYNDPRSKILPQHSFLPVNAQRKRAPVKGILYGEQFWGSTHSLYGRIGINDMGVGIIGARGIRKF